LALVFGVVLLNVALNVHHVVKYWAELTLVHHMIGGVLWFILPLWAVFLLWCGRNSGRWILVGLFGFRTAVGLFDLGTLGPMLVHDPWILIDTFRWPVLETMFYFGATEWLIFSRGVRSLCSRAGPAVPS